VAAVFDHHTGAILLTDEALNGRVDDLADAVAAQPPWSDAPFILLTSRHPDGLLLPEQAGQRLLSLVTNVVVLERPLGYAFAVERRRYGAEKQATSIRSSRSHPMHRSREATANRCSSWKTTPPYAC
jgi:hypothetical protein